MNENNKKRIIIGLPKSFGVNELIVKNLELLNFEVYNISYPEHGKLKKSLLQKLIYSYRKLILGDRNYKSILKFAPYRSELEKLIDSIEGKVDYTLLIRADIYPIDFVLKLKEKSNVIITYHWDGLHRFPAIKKMIPFFDRFFIFDPNDNQHQFLPTTNFYFDSESSVPEKNPEFDLYFMGSYITNRMPIISEFIKKTNSLSLKTKFIVFCTSASKKAKFNDTAIEYISSHISYSENIENIKKSKVVLDFLNGTHHGLSFRVFEAIQFDRKLITNNSEIKKYDFYHPNNIYVWNGADTNGLNAFLNSKYLALPKIKETYSFSNWIKNILDIPPYNTIKLPNKY